jgi:chromosome segregation ATPase
MNVLKLFQSSPSDDKRLDAIAARTEAQRKVVESRETLARLQAVIDQADTAARTAAKATREASAARQLWVRDGCLENARAHHTLADAATEATRAAESSGRDADAVRKELARAEQAIESAQSNFRDCDNRVKQVVFAGFIDEMAPTLERRARLLAEVHDCDIAIRGLVEYLDGVSGIEARRLEDAASRVRIEAISTYTVLPSGKVISTPPDEVLALTRVWSERAKTLCANSDSDK